MRVQITESARKVEKVQLSNGELSSPDELRKAVTCNSLEAHELLELSLLVGGSANSRTLWGESVRVRRPIRWTCVGGVEIHATVDHPDIGEGKPLPELPVVHTDHSFQQCLATGVGVFTVLDACSRRAAGQWVRVGEMTYQVFSEGFMALVQLNTFGGTHRIIDVAAM